MKSIERVLKVPNEYHHFDNECIIMNRMSKGKTLMVDTRPVGTGVPSGEMSKGKTLMVDTRPSALPTAARWMSKGKTLMVDTRQ